MDVNPPATRILGKSPEYVAAYSDAYKKEGKHIRTSKALTGCIIGVLVEVVIEVIVIAGSSSSASH